MAISNELVNTTSDDDASIIKLEKSSPLQRRPSIFESTNNTSGMTFIHDPTILKKTPKKKKHNSQSQEEESEASTSKRSGSELDSSTPDTPTKKQKKEKKQPLAPQPPESKPPSTVFKYFVEKVHAGKKEKAQRAYDKLSKKARKQLTVDYNNTVETYVSQLKAYLSTLPKEDAIKYVSF